ncbi:C-TERMINALLY ENCODED PEPTIDE 3 [Hibiscus trionum]|uniref:C-TERMINALLY ENCODED PEPTIDE 3 n=1 Tax=Hibiscus trionum TaxID=183268 RepID=A0A9W7H0H2_HIBTR|nr:C-TERMINALLY ENCODED PEPTIDE 3 [Hibiscus trionum]
MASFKVKNVCILFLVLIICQQMFVEGRHLRSKTSCKKCSTQPDGNTFKVPENGNHSVGSGVERSSKVENIDDFRPTAPGHSPGAGHSIHT